jgi:hypothetical protein
MVAKGHKITNVPLFKKLWEGRLMRRWLAEKEGRLERRGKLKTEKEKLGIRDRFSRGGRRKEG